MIVLFYTATAYLDISLEIINILKSRVELHVLIEITEGSKKHNIINIDKLPETEIFVPANVLISNEAYKNFSPYFDEAASVNFVVHARKNVLSSLTVLNRMRQFVNTLNPDVFHLEAMMVRSLGLIPAILRCKKLLISIHDPLPHSGEKDWKIGITKLLLYNLPIKKGFFFYSKFARDLFDKHSNQRKEKRHVVIMGSYSYFSRLLNTKSEARKYILLFGRLSPYKGIESLLKAMTEVWKVYPNETLVIAGKSYKNYVPELNLVDQTLGKINMMNYYISNDTLAGLIDESKFVVCPYTDATQSGVLMTAFALNKPVIATNTGAFPEYINDGVDGLIVPVNDAAALSKAIIKALHDNYFTLLEQNIALKNKHNSWEQNIPLFLNAYSS